MAYDAIPVHFFRRAAERPDADAYAVRTAPGSWKTTSWGTHAREVRQAARALAALGVGKGDRVAILGFNCPAWTTVDLAALTLGAVPFGIYQTAAPEQIAYILNQSKAEVLVVRAADDWDRACGILDECESVRHVIVMPGGPDTGHAKALSWEAFSARAADTPDSLIDERLAEFEEDALATMIYTSGTTGKPKGVMLSHGNLIAALRIAQNLKGVQGWGGKQVSYLPLAHVAEHNLSVYLPALTGHTIYYAPSIEGLREALNEVQPTLFFAVPRVWEKMQAAVEVKIAEATGAKAKLLAWARGVATEVSALRARGKHPTGLLAAKYGLAEKLVLGKVRHALGLGSATFTAVGAAPIAVSTQEFFASLGILVQEVYGMSEGAGITTFNHAGRVHFGTAGQPAKDCEVKLLDDGEILLRGPNVFLGYYEKPEETAETLVDGWLHSGDLGAFDAEGNLTITGRKKDLLITSGGKNIAPRKIEALLQEHALVGEAMAVGDRRKYVAALITLEDEARAAYAEAIGADPDTIHENPRLLADLQKHVDACNEHLARVETVKRFAVLPRMFSVDEGELTSSLKLKRHVVTERYAGVIDGLYG